MCTIGRARKPGVLGYAERHRISVLASLALWAAVLGLAMTHQPVLGKEPRFPQLRMEELNEQQRALAAEIMKISSVGIGGPYNALLRSPVLAERMFRLLDYLRFNSSVPRKLNEFAILIVARLWTSQVEWFAHYPLAIKAGLSEPVAADLKQGKRPGDMQQDEAAVYDFCIELATSHEVSDLSFKQIRNVLSEQQVVDLVSLTGTYITIAMLLSAAEQEVPQGHTPPLERLAVSKPGGEP
jgi:4-carboxymuconolactone decarboxylase